MARPVRIEFSPVEAHPFHIAPELVGQAIPLGTHAGIRLEVALPTDIDDSYMTRHPPREDAPGHISGFESGTPLQVRVRRFVVRAYWETEMDALATGILTPNEDEQEEVWRLRSTAAGVAERVVRTFVDLVAVRRREFNLTLRRPPEPNASSVFVGTAQEPLRFGKKHFLTAPRSGGLGLADAAALAGIMVSDDPGHLGWRLYAQAYRELRIERDVRHALLMAAMAAEIGTKQALLRKNPDPVVQLLLRRAHVDALRNDVAAAIIGTRYKQVDSRNDGLLHQLAEARNAVIHHGKEAPSPERVENWLSAVEALLTWLDAEVP